MSVHEYDWGDPDGLAREGPWLAVEVSVPSALAEQIIGQQEQPPAPIPGRALMDTGASRTCIDEQVCQGLGISTTDTVLLQTAGGEASCSCYPVRLEFPGTEYGPFEIDAVGVDLAEAGCILLLGRDLLSSAKLVYNGLMGRVELMY